MNINIIGKGCDLTAESQTLIESKLSALDKLTHRDETTVLACEIEESLSVERAGAKYRATGNLTINGKNFHASAMGATLEGAVDDVRDELAREVKKARGKATHLLRRGGSKLKDMLRFGR